MLILLGALTKSAQFPFHFWLPQRHGGADAGLGLPAFGDHGEGRRVSAGAPVAGAWRAPTNGSGSSALRAWRRFCSAPIFAIFQQDLKGLLAYSTISHLGLITLLLGLGSPLGAVAAIFHMMNHATFKASLFMAAGIIDHETGTRDMRRLSGLFRYMPITATLAMVASAAMAGVPLLNGFLSKEMFFAEARRDPRQLVLDTVAPYVAVAGQRVCASPIPCASSIRLLRAAAGGSAARRRTSRRSGCACRSMFLVLACLVVGIIPAVTIGPISAHRRAHPCWAPRRPTYSLAVWHGFTLPLIMSASRWSAAPCSIWRCESYLQRQPDRPAAASPPRRASASSSACWSCCRWRWARPLETAAGHATACSRNCDPARWRRRRRGAGSARYSAASACDGSAWRVDRSGVRAGLAGRHRLRRRRGLPGQVPSAGGAYAAGRRRACHLHHLRLVFRARSGADPAARRDRDDGADSARPALAAQALRGHDTGSAPSATLRCAARATSPSPSSPGAGLATLAYAVMTRAAARHDRAASSSSTPTPKAAAAMSST